MGRGRRREWGRRLWIRVPTSPISPTQSRSCLSTSPISPTQGRSIFSPSFFFLSSSTPHRSHLSFFFLSSISPEFFFCGCGLIFLAWVFVGFIFVVVGWLWDHNFWLWFFLGGGGGLGVVVLIIRGLIGCVWLLRKWRKITVFIRLWTNPWILFGFLAKFSYWFCWRRKRNFISKKSFSFVSSFSRESRVETRDSKKGNPRKCWGFHFNGILVILIIG